MKRYTSQRAIRAAFWDLGLAIQIICPRVPGRTQNQYSADIRMAFVDFVDQLQKSGEISVRLADRATL